MAEGRNSGINVSVVTTSTDVSGVSILKAGRRSYGINIIMAESRNSGINVSVISA